MRSESSETKEEPSNSKPNVSGTGSSGELTATFVSEIAELMAVKSKHGAGGEFTPDWAPKVRRSELFCFSHLVQLSQSTNNLCCQKCHLHQWRLKIVDPHNQQSLLGARYINDLRGSASRSPLVLLPHRLPRHWLLHRQSNKSCPRGLNGNVCDPAAARKIVLSCDVVGACSRSPCVTRTPPADADYVPSPRGRATTPHGTFRYVMAVTETATDLTRTLRLRTTITPAQVRSPGISYGLERACSMTFLSLLYYGIL